MTTDNNELNSPRAIPPVPGGGSWTFDYDLWQWVANHPAPVVEVAADADAAPIHNPPTVEE